MRKRIRITVTSIVFVMLAVSALHFSAAAAKPTDKTKSAQDESIDCALSAFNDSIQERFKVVDRYFGYKRIIRPDDSAHNFKPDKAKEFKDVGELKAAHLTVALYLTSRAVLGEPLKGKNGVIDEKYDNDLNARFLPQNALGRAIKGPAVITGKDEQFSDLPKRSELWEQSRIALKSFDHNDNYDFTMKGWQFSARPVRASQESCLQCHNPNYAGPAPMVVDIKTGKEVEKKDGLKLGDTLGVVLYAYKQAKN
jgi:hypothetical protein